MASHKIYKRALFVFRRDLRISDNTALNEALKLSGEVITCFIFDPVQVEKNTYRSDNALQFMFEALESLEEEVEKKGGRLLFLQGHPHAVAEELHKEFAYDALFINKDYTPYARKRDNALQAFAKKHDIAFHECADVLLHDPVETVKDDGSPYTVFTPFFKRASKKVISFPVKVATGSFFSKKTKDTLGLASLRKSILGQQNENLFVHGSKVDRAHVLKGIEHVAHYEKTHDFPSVEHGTSHLSAYLKFGVISVREAYHRVSELFGAHHPLIRQLYWRDFYYSIAHFFPDVFGSAFIKKYQGVTWSHDKELFKAWCEGKTGFPIVDAGMRQLNETGFMHNRVRMITASFLTKDLHIDWQWGEKYFAQKLVDYDPCLNNGNWQWVASVGCDPQPYFRIFNPWLQQKKFDPQVEYIKQWVPELRGHEAQKIHNEKYLSLIKGYERLRLDHAQEADRAKKQFQKY